MKKENTFNEDIYEGVVPPSKRNDVINYNEVDYETIFMSMRNNIPEEIERIKNQSVLTIISNFLFGSKSCMPDELKSF